ncbi:hypothetical protein EW145_g2652 [Phellinidium pouzarii]|uniref:Uncharacterized protein n=1 Tax=Phellinidium pouzarii TaxID=167371 RepID=A0A4S4LA15_9AGAM|nr:hypothetical protein EW145_g2652 [Phellinidium pouzarii]
MLLPTGGQNGGAIGTLISNSDPSITYSPKVCISTDDTDCYGAWWNTNIDDGSVIKTTAGPSVMYDNAQTSLTMSFYGTSLEVHGLRDVAGANMIVQLDNMAGTINTSTGAAGASQQPSLLASYSGLDAQTVHTLALQWFANSYDGDNSEYSYAYFDHLMVGDFRAVESSSTTSSAQASTPSSTSRPSFGVTAGIVVAVLVFILLFFVASFYLLRHRRRFSYHGQSSQKIKVMIDSFEGQHTDGSDPSSPSESILKAHPHMSLPPAYFTSWNATRKNVKGGTDAYQSVSYLDLESGAGHSDEGPRDIDAEGTNGRRSPSVPIRRKRTEMKHRSQKKGKNRRSLFPAPLLISSSSTSMSPRASNVSYPPQVHLHPSQAFEAKGTSRASGSGGRVSVTGGTRGQVDVLAGEKSGEESPTTPYTPYTPYSVGTAMRTTVRPQNAQLIQPVSFSASVPTSSSASGSQSRLQSRAGVSATGRPSRKSKSITRNDVDVPLPPLPPLPSPHEEKKRLAKMYNAPTSSRASTSRASGITISVTPPRALGSFGSDLGMESSSASSSLLDARKSMANVSLRSLPPPYALHP